MIDFARMLHLVVSLSLAGKQSQHLIKRVAADRLCHKNAEPWVPVAFLTVERPL